MDINYDDVNACCQVAMNSHVKYSTFYPLVPGRKIKIVYQILTKPIGFTPTQAKEMYNDLKQFVTPNYPNVCIDFRYYSTSNKYYPGYIHVLFWKKRLFSSKKHRFYMLHAHSDFDDIYANFACLAPTR